MRAFISRIKPWQVVLVFCLVYLGIILADNKFDSKVFVTIGTCFAPCDGYTGSCPAGKDKGYDGQFTFYIARDPLHASGCLDVPAYRYQRILLPVLGRALALGNADWIPITLVLVNLATLVYSTALLTDLLVARKVSRWYALVYGLSVGVVMGVRLSTVEPLAYGLVILAIWMGERGNLRGQAVALAAAVLAKETTLTFVAGYLLFDALNRNWKHAFWLGLAVGLPFLIWQITLYLWLGSFGAGSGGAENSPFEIIPFNGFFRVAYDPTGSVSAFLLLSLYTVPAAILPSLWGLWVTTRELLRKQYHLYTCLLFANAAIMAFVPFSTYREPLGVFRFIVGLVIAHLLYASLRYPRSRPMVYSTLWLALLIYLTAG